MNETPKTSAEAVTDRRYVVWNLPFIQENYAAFSDKIRKINKQLPSTVQIRPVFKVNKTKNYFFNKDKVSSELKSRCVYSYTCGQCEKVYLGETSRHLASRMAEHLKGQPVPSEISLHIHPTNLKNFSVVAVTKNHKLLESILIKQSRDLLNEREGSYPLLLVL